VTKRLLLVAYLFEQAREVVVRIRHIRRESQTRLVANQRIMMYCVDGDTGEIVNRRFGRDDLIGYLSRRPPGRVALEACGSAHWWARKIKALGHDVARAETIERTTRLVVAGVHSRTPGVRLNTR